MVLDDSSCHIWGYPYPKHVSSQFRNTNVHNVSTILHIPTNLVSLNVYGVNLSDGVNVVTLLSFQYSSAAMIWCFDDFTLLYTSACSRNVLFAFKSFNPAAFPITNNLDVSYYVTSSGRNVLLGFVPYQINSPALQRCSFLWFGSEVDIMLVSISKMNQENKRVSVITHQYCFTCF